LHYAYGYKAISAWVDPGFVKEWKKKVSEPKKPAKVPTATPGRPIPGNHDRTRVRLKLDERRNEAAGSRKAAGAPDDSTDFAYELIRCLWEAPLQQERKKRLFEGIDAWRMSVPESDR
jgi:hypothetical protein